jgi:hypothetical protein
MKYGLTDFSFLHIQEVKTLIGCLVRGRHYYFRVARANRLCSKCTTGMKITKITTINYIKTWGIDN